MSKVRLIIKDRGSIDLELLSEYAPKTVDNFLKLVEKKFYDGLIFHRVIKNFMIQGGCPDGTGMGGSDTHIVGEFESNGHSNGLRHERGVISMARSQHPDSASSQFFICHKDAPHLNGGYAAFGRVIAGQEVVDAIAETETGRNDRPLEDVVIESAYVLERESVRND